MIIKRKPLTLLKKIRRAAAFQSNTILERENVVKGLWSAILAGEHVFLLGPPGTGKSLLLTSLEGLISDANVFTKLISKTTKPEELFGPPSIVDLKNGVYKTVTAGTLAETDFAYLDEIFKGSGAILNTLLTAINERAYDNPTRIDIPLKTMVCSSNELPADDDNLTALFDRILMKYHVEYLKDESSFEALLDMGDVDFIEMMSLDDLKLAQAEAMSTPVATATREIIMKLWRLLPTEGFVVSDRTWRKSMKILKAHAWLHGRDEVHPTDLEILADIFWTDPSQRTSLIKLILKESSTEGGSALEIIEQVKSIRQAALTAISMEASESVKAVFAGDALAKLTSLGQKIAELDQSNARVARANNDRNAARRAIVVAAGI